MKVLGAKFVMARNKRGRKGKGMGHIFSHFTGCAVILSTLVADFAFAFSISAGYHGGRKAFRRENWTPKRFQTASELQHKGLSNLLLTKDISDESQPDSEKPQTFREAEILGLKAMQKSDYNGALRWFNEALKLPGTKRDIIRTQTLSGPSPVGGSAGGRTSQYSLTLDEFEYQAAHYNMACANCCIGQTDEAFLNLEKSFQYGFDNLKAVEMDPDLQDLQALPQFQELVNKYFPKRKRRSNRGEEGGGLNPLRFLS